MITGVADHAGWAVLVTVSGEGSLLDRRRVALVEEGLPVMPHHVEGQALPLHQAVALVERVRESAEKCAIAVLGELPPGVVGIALRECPALPATVAERLTDYRSRNVADWVMYRQALAAAAVARGWAVQWYDAKKVLEGEDLRGLRKLVGPPWDKDHRVAMAAAVAAAKGSA